MSHLLVTMTHINLPGVDKTVSIEAYRTVYYGKGWRSDDDPDFVGVEDADEPPSMGVHETERHKPYVRVPGEWGTHWYAARRDADIRQVIVQGWGDSIMAGSAASNPRDLGWFGLLGTELKARYGDGGTGYLPWNVPTSQTGSWTTGYGFGASSGTATAAASLTWTSLAGTRLRIFHRNVTSPTGTYRYRIDAGSWNNVTPPTGVAIEPGVVEVTGLADTAHSLELEWVSGTIGFYGIDCTRPTGIVMHRCAQSGRAGSDFSRILLQRIAVSTTNTSTTITAAGAGVFTSTMIGKYLAGTGIPTDTTITAVASATSATISAAATATGAITADLSVNPGSRPSIGDNTINPPFGLAPGLGRADLLLIGLMVNDPAGANNTPASLVEGIASIIAPHVTGGTVAYSPDMVFSLTPLGTWFDTVRQYSAYAGAVGGMAQGLGAAVIDHWGRWRRSWKYANDNGWMNDSVHPSTAGHADMAEPFIDLLTSPA